MELSLILCSLALAVGPVDSAAAETAGPPVEFDDAVSLRNAYIRVDVSPQAGRVVWFGRHDGPNVLWINRADAVETARLQNGAYIDYGGDKLWPSAQALWGRARGDGTNWPPDRMIDGAPWELVEASDHHLKIKSPRSTHFGVRVQRTIVIDPDVAAVTIVNDITRETASVYPVHLWSVTQIERPRFVLLDIARHRVGTRPPVVLWQDPDHYEGGVKTGPHETVAAWHFRHAQLAQIGTLGSWNAAVFDQDIFLQSTLFKPDGAYPDGTSVQIRSEPRHVELALLSEFVHLQPGASLKNIVEWRLIEATDPSPESVMELIHAVR